MDLRPLLLPIGAGLNMSFGGLLRWMDLWKILALGRLSARFFSAQLDTFSHLVGLQGFLFTVRAHTRLRLISLVCATGARGYRHARIRSSCATSARGSHLPSIRQLLFSSIQGTYRASACRVLFSRVAYSLFLSVERSHCHHRPMSSKDPLRTDAVKAAAGMMRATSIITASAIPT